MPISVHLEAADIISQYLFVYFTHELFYSLTSRQDTDDCFIDWFLGHIYVILYVFGIHKYPIVEF